MSRDWSQERSRNTSDDSDMKRKRAGIVTCPPVFIVAPTDDSAGFEPRLCARSPARLAASPTLHRPFGRKTCRTSGAQCRTVLRGHKITENRDVPAPVITCARAAIAAAARRARARSMSAPIPRSPNWTGGNRPMRHARQRSPTAPRREVKSPAIFPCEPGG